MLVLSGKLLFWSEGHCPKQGYQETWVYSWCMLLRMVGRGSLVAHQILVPTVHVFAEVIDHYTKSLKRQSHDRISSIYSQNDVCIITLTANGGSRKKVASKRWIHHLVGVSSSVILRGRVITWRCISDRSFLAGMGVMVYIEWHVTHFTWILVHLDIKRGWCKTIILGGVVSLNQEGLHQNMPQNPYM